MNKQLVANIKTNLKFYRRSKLLVVIGIFSIFICIIILIPSLLFISPGNKFVIIRQIISISELFIKIFISALGILAITYHINNRCYKMVITKPCLPDIWLLSNFISALLITSLLYLLLLVLSVILFLIWHIPFQFGVLYIVFDGIFRTTITFSMLIFLVIVIHPFIAVLLVVLIDSGIIRYLILLVSAGLSTTTNSYYKFIFTIEKYFFYLIYIVFPSSEPLYDKTREIYSGLKFIPSDLKYLGLTFLYTAVISSLFYFLADYSLKKRRLT